MGSDERVEAPAVGRNLLAAEEALDVAMGGQVAEGCKLRAVERDMMRVEIDDVDRARRPCEISEDVAATRADRHDAVVGAKRHRLHVDIRVLPDLRVDEAGKKQAEKALGKALAGQRPVLQA